MVSSSMASMRSITILYRDKHTLHLINMIIVGNPTCTRGTLDCSRWNRSISPSQCPSFWSLHPRRGESFGVSPRIYMKFIDRWGIYSLLNLLLQRQDLFYLRA